MADDVGIWNISAYHRGMMGGSTPNIDRLAREGALFTDYYGQQSCTGRAAFITGQTPFRTGLLKSACPQRNRACRIPIRRSRNCSSHSATRRHRSARTTGGSQRVPAHSPMDSTSSTGSSTTSMRWRNPTTRSIRRTKNSAKVRPTQRHPQRCDRRRRSDEAPRRWGRVGKQKITDAGPLPPHPGLNPAAKVNMEDIDADLVSVVRLHPPLGEGEATVLPAQLHALSLLYASFKEVDGKTGFDCLPMRSQSWTGSWANCSPRWTNLASPRIRS